MSTVTIGRLKKRIVLRETLSLLCGFIALVAVISLFLCTRIQLGSFSPSRAYQLHVLIQSAHTSGHIDPVFFWKLRDQYGSGFFTLAPDHTIFRETQELVLPPRSEWIQFAQYTGKRVTSTDYLTPWTNKPPSTYRVFLDLITPAEVRSRKLLFESDNARIYEADHNGMTIVFVASIEDMAKVYGLYNFTDNIRTSLNGRLWANMTMFTP